jgi:hypothetical protein
MANDLMKKPGRESPGFWIAPLRREDQRSRLPIHSTTPAIIRAVMPSRNMVRNHHTRWLPSLIHVITGRVFVHSFHQPPFTTCDW